MTSSQKFDVALANLKETVGTKLLPFVEKLVDVATKLIDKFSNLDPKVQNVIIGFTGVVAIGGPLLTFLANAKTAFLTLTGIQGATKIATDLTTGAIAGQTVATGAATTATKLLRVALASTGIGLLIVAIGTLIANFDKVKETVLAVLVPTVKSPFNRQVPPTPLNVIGKSKVSPFVVIILVPLVAANVQTFVPAVNVGDVPLIVKSP